MKKKAPKTKTLIAGTKVTFEKVAFNEYPAPRYHRDDGVISVPGVGSAGFMGHHDYMRATKHRTGFVIVGNALVVDNAKALPNINEFVRHNPKLTQHSSLQDVHKALTSILAESSVDSPRRWATQAETNAWVAAELAFRKKIYDKAIANLKRRLNSARSNAKAGAIQAQTQTRIADALEAKLEALKIA